jgi:DNA-binding transcriptional regulator YdaS (Cro superfamily)
MDLKAFLASLPRGGSSSFAREVGISPIYLSQLAARQDGREAKPELCVVIERKSGWQVRRWDLRPEDWRRIWPELIEAPGAPPAAEPATAGEG